MQNRIASVSSTRTLGLTDFRRPRTAVICTQAYVCWMHASNLSRDLASTGATEFYPEQRCGKGRPNKGLALAPPAFALPASHLSLCLSHRLSRRVVCFSICRCMVLHSRSAVVALRMVADRVWRRHRSGAERCRIAALPIIAAADHRRCRSCGRRACTDTLLWERCRGRARQSSYVEEASTRSHDG